MPGSCFFAVIHASEYMDEFLSASFDINTCKCSVERATEDEDTLLHCKAMLLWIITNSRKGQVDFRLTKA